MTDDLRPPYRIAFDNARDPYTARNALGITPAGTVSPTRTITAGAGLTGGGDLSANRTIDVGAGTGITVNANDVALTVPVSVANGGTGSTTVGGGPFVQKAGDTMTGDLTIAKTHPALILNKGASGELNYIVSKTAGLSRWQINFGSVAAESGGNAGSDFELYRMNDAGVSIDRPILIARSTGIVVMGAGATIKGVTDGSSAAAGYVGEYVETVGGSIAVGATATTALVSMAFSAGDWDVWGVAKFSSGTLGSRFLLSHSNSTGLDTTIGRIVSNVVTPDGDCYVATPIVRQSLTGTTTLYMVAFNTAAGTVNASKIMGRRVR